MKMATFVTLLLFAILDVIESTSCQPGRVYCAYQLRLNFKFWDAHRIRIKCGDDGQIKHVFRACYSNCTHRGDGGDAFCQCLVGAKYCGHELRLLGMNGYEDNTIYACIHGGLNVRTIEKCTGECVVYGLRLSVTCAGRCEPGGYYCGHQLTTISWDGYDNNTIYQCGDDGYTVNNITVCSNGCSQGDKPRASCKCIPGRMYCLSHLVNTMNWQFDSALMRDYGQSLFRCRTCGREVHTTVNAGTCTTACIQRGHSNAFCKCIAKLKYCGYVLNRLGWQQCSGNPDTAPDDYNCKEYDNNTLYYCTNSGVNVLALEACTSECIGGMGRSACVKPCDEGKFYCGYVLHEMGLSGYDDHSIYRCNGSGEPTIVTTCSDDSCIQSRSIPDVKCPCVPGRYYCGHQLRSKFNWRRLWDHDERAATDALFLCTDLPSHADLTAHCRVCVARMDTDSFCPCIPGNIYCGSLLNKMGMKDCVPENGQCHKYIDDTAYKCADDGRRAVSLGLKAEYCRACKPGRTYCGYQLQRRISVWQDHLNILYGCSGNSNDTVYGIAQCIMCITDKPNSHCMCIPRSRYCGYWLTKNGYLGYDNDTVYSCSNDGTPGAKIETCFPGECRQGNHYGYCPCKPGKLYCGRELYEHYNELHTFLTANAIYECSSDRKRVNSNVTCTNGCVSSPARCKKPCVPNQHYCGSDLTREEGWEEEGLLHDSLYQCFNETTATQVQNCTDGCETVIGGGAICKGAPTPWYWFFMATTLPLVFLSLAGLVIRGLVRHRRLKKFLRQHRIDFSQLTLGTRLGSGHFGQVWKATYRNDQNQLLDVALKICNSPSPDHPGLASARCFFQETILSLQFLKHRNITMAYGVCSNFRLNARVERTPALVMEFMNGGSAIQYVKEERHRLVHQDFVHIFCDVCQAGKHLHKVRVIHRDIGARNVLIQKDPLTGRPVIAKLTDLGLAKDLGQSTDVYTSTGEQVFHMRYTAPEGFDGQFSSKSDVWSFGVFMWEVYMLMEDPDPGDDQSSSAGPVPFAMFSERAEILEALQNRRRLMQPDSAPQYMYTIMKHCWEMEPDQRPTFSELVSQFQTNRNYAYHEPITAPIEDLELQDIVEEPPDPTDDQDRGPAPDPTQHLSTDRVPDPTQDPSRDIAPQGQSTVDVGGPLGQNQNQNTSAQQADFAEEASDEPLNTLADPIEGSDDEGGKPGPSHCGAGNRRPNLSGYKTGAAILNDHRTDR